MRLKALVAVRDQGQHFTLTGQHSRVNAAHLSPQTGAVASEFASKPGPSLFLPFHILYSD